MRFLLVIVAATVLLVPAPALAYMDPGSGSMLLQMLLAGVAGLAVTFKLFWSRIKRAFRKPAPTPSVLPAQPHPQDHQSK